MIAHIPDWNQSVNFRVLIDWRYGIQSRHYSRDGPSVEHKQAKILQMYAFIT